MKSTREPVDEIIARKNPLHVIERPKEFAPLCVVWFIVRLRQYEVSPILESKILHRGEYSPERPQNLYHGCYLPVEVPADNIHVESRCPAPLTRIHPQGNAPVIEPQRGTAKPEVLRHAHKL